MKFEAKLAILIFVLVSPWMVYLGFNPDMSNVIVASGTMLMAFGTFLMAYFTYISYKNLSDIQKASMEPALSISLWRVAHQGGVSLSDYGITVKNDGNGIAKKVMLWFNWAIKEEKGKERKLTDRKFGKYDLYGDARIEVGNIASKDKIDISSKVFPPPGGFKENDLYGVILKVTCEDVLGNEEEKYFDLKKIYLSDAEIRKLE